MSTLLGLVFGEYFGVIPITAFTRKSGPSNAATPEWADKNGVRIIFANEAEFNDHLLVGEMKSKTGKEFIIARPLFCAPFKYMPMFKIVITCNTKPNVQTSPFDNGTWRRILVLLFGSKFVEDNPKGDRQFLIDETLDDDFPDWRQPFMWLLINKYYEVYEKKIS